MRLLLVVFLVSAADSAAQHYGWRNFVPRNNIHQMLQLGDSIIVGTADGGQFNISISTGEIRYVNVINSALPFNQITCMDVDPSGRLWYGFGSWGSYEKIYGGVARLDSNGWQLWNMQNSGLLFNDPIRMMVDDTGTVIAVTGDWEIGASRFHHGQWDTLLYPTTLPDPSLKVAEDIARDSSGHYYFATMGGVLKFDGQSWELFDASNTIPELVQCRRIEFDPTTNDMWVGTWDGVRKFDGTTWSVPFTLGMVNDFAFHGDNVYVATSEGLYVYDNTVNSVVKLHPTDVGGLGYTVSAVLIDTAGQLWVGARGVFRWDGQSWVQYPVTHDWISNIYCGYLYAGSSGKVWFVCGYDLTEFDGAIKTYSLGPYAVVTLSEDRNGKLLLGSSPYYTGTPGLLILNGQTIQPLTNRHTYCLRYSSSDSLLWVRDELGMWTWDGDTLIKRFDPSVIGQKFVIDRDGVFWSLNPPPDRNLYRWDGTQLTVTSIPTASGAWAQDLAVDFERQVWITGSPELIRYDEVGFTKFDSTNLPWRVYYTFRVFIDAYDVKWIAVNSDEFAGVIALDSTTWFYLDRMNSGLTFHDITGMVYDKNGCMWFTMAGGGASQFCGYSYISSPKGEGEATISPFPEAIETTVFPNPTRDVIIIQPGDFSEWTCEVYDLNGSLLKSYTFRGKTTMSTDQLAEGLYVLHLRSAGGLTRAVKVVVSR